MKIALLGQNALVKSKLAEGFVNLWPMYKRPLVPYRDFISPSKLEQADEKEAIRLVLDAVTEEVKFETDKNVIFDHCIIDSVIAALYLNGKGIADDNFINECRIMAAQALQYFDVIFYCPRRPELETTVEEDVEEIENITKAVITSYEKNTGAIFPLKDCPAVITLEGPLDIWVSQLQLYIKADGQPYGEEDKSLIADLPVD